LALEAYASALRDVRRHGNYADADTTIRTRVELFAAIGEDRGATMLAAATSDYVSPDGSPFSGRIATSIEGVRSRVGESRFAAWDAAGSRLAVDEALRIAAELVDQNR
jgi:hypothetical protein